MMNEVFNRSAISDDPELLDAVGGDGGYADTCYSLCEIGCQTKNGVYEVSFWGGVIV